MGMSASATTRPVVTRALGVRAVDPAVWRRLTPRGADFYGCLPWLAAQEEVSGQPQRLLVATEGEEVTAVLPYALPEREFNQFYEPRALWGDAAPTADGLLHLGVGRGYYNPVLLTSAEGGRRAAAVAALAAEVALLSREAGRPAVAQYVRAETADEAAALLGGRGTTVLPVALNAVIRLTGTGFDDYLSGFDAHKSRRGRVRHERRRFAEAGYRTAGERLSDCHRELAPLLVQLQHKHGQSATVDFTERLLRSQAAHLDGTVFTCRLDGDLVAFSLVYLWHDALYVRMAGFDYARLAGAFEYFNLTTYLPIEHAYAHGAREVHLGMESYRGKLLRRAELEPLLTVMGPGTSDDPDLLRAAAWRRVRELEGEVPDPVRAFPLKEG